MKYEESIRGNISRYLAMVGEQFEAKVNRLNQLIDDFPHPSTGSYREKLLIDLVREHLPKKAAVGTGFVYFPVENTKEVGLGDTQTTLLADKLISPQCDILIYDPENYAPIFKDGDFVVLKPESVYAVIEVKSKLSVKTIKDSMQTLIKFGSQWRTTAKFYKSSDLPELRLPMLFSFFWAIEQNSKGKNRISIKNTRDKIIESICNTDEFNNRELDDFPLLHDLFVFNEFMISAVSDDKSFGYASYKAQSKILKNGSYEAQGDKSIAMLLAFVQYAIDAPLNRFFIYPDHQVDKISSNKDMYGYHPILLQTRFNDYGLFVE